MVLPLGGTEPVFLSILGPGTSSYDLTGLSPYPLQLRKCYCFELSVEFGGRIPDLNLKSSS